MRLRHLIVTFALFALAAAAHPSRADEVETLFAGRSAAEWDTARDSARLKDEFTADELANAQGESAMRWTFVSRGVTFNDIFLRKEIARPFTTVRLRVRCLGSPITLAAKVADSDMAEWTANQVHVDSAAGWQWIEFPASAWKVASWSRDADGRMDFPLAYFALIVFDVKPGEPNELLVSRLEVVRPDPPVAAIREFRMPSEVTHGRTYPVELSLSVNRRPVDPTVSLVFRRHGSVAFETPLRPAPAATAIEPGKVLRLWAARIALPEFISGGSYTVGLRIGDARCLWRGRRVDREALTVHVRGRTHTSSVAEIRPYHGAPTLFIDGKPQNGMTYTAYDPSVEVFHDFAKAGINLYSFAATPTESGYGLSKTAWTAPGVYDFSELDRRVNMVLQANPNARFFPRLYLHAPKWWSAQHPDDLVLVDPNDGKPVPFIHNGEKPAPGWASEPWRRATIEGLRRLIAHVEASPYADRCIGYHLASGSTEEWMMWGANENEWVDYSPANVAKFRTWLRAKYGTTDRLRTAWADQGVTFETAAIPTKAQRLTADLGSFHEPRRERAVVDYYLYNSWLVGDTITTFAKAVKEITHRKKIVGVFYGYLLQLCGEQRQQNAGHLALAKVLSSPDVDFVCSPTSYAFRQLGGEGTAHFMSLQASVKLHGKLWFDENDIRTSLSGGQIGEWGRPKDVAGDIIQQEKELALCLTSGAAQWWFDVGGNRYNDPRLMQRVAGLTRTAAKAITLDRTPVDEVAMVVDEDSLCNLRVGDPLGAFLLVSQLPALQRIGAPVGHYLVEDLPRIADRKVFLIMTSFAPSAEQRAAIDGLKRDGHVLVFFCAPGLFRDGRMNERSMEAFTGIRLRQGAASPYAAAALKVTLLGGHPLTEGLAGGVYGVEHAAWPVVYADDPAATVVGTFAAGRAGLVVKPQNGWTAIFSAAPMMPTPLLRRIAQRGHVHEYIDTEDVVWASHDLLAVCVKDAGPRTIRLSRAADVTDMYSGEKIGTHLREFRAEFAKDQTRLFVVR